MTLLLSTLKCVSEDSDPTVKGMAPSSRLASRMTSLFPSEQQGPQTTTTRGRQQTAQRQHTRGTSHALQPADDMTENTSLLPATHAPVSVASLTEAMSWLPTLTGCCQTAD